MSTFEPTCYEKNDPFQGMIDYYNTTMKLHKKYDVYKALKRHGITPGHRYDTSRVQKAIKKEFNMFPDLRCNTDGHLVETWMYFYVNVSAMNDGKEQLADILLSLGACQTHGFGTYS
jgi:ribonuclease T2